MDTMHYDDVAAGAAEYIIEHQGIGLYIRAFMRHFPEARDDQAWVLHILGENAF